MHFHSVDFIKSSADISTLPKDDKTDFAFIGRSNVGKSSFINTLIGSKKCCKISSKPGKTKLINHFLVNNCFYLVDLPGYGYAKVSKSQRDDFIRLIESYIVYRKSLKKLYVLIDASIPLQYIDITFMEFLVEYKIPFAVIGNKVDKIKKSVRKQMQNKIKNELKERVPLIKDVYFCSASKDIGVSCITEEINKH